MKKRDPSGAALPQDDNRTRRQDDKKIQRQDGKRLSQVLAGVSVLIVLLHAWGTLWPSHDNWGVHVFAFYDPSIMFLALAFTVLLLLPKTNARVLGIFDGLVRRLATLPQLAGFVIVAGTLLGAAALFPVKLHLLGDGALLLRTASYFYWSGELAATFRNQPLMIWIFRSVMSFVSQAGSVKPYDVYVAIDLLGCVMFVAVVFWFVRSMDRPRSEQVLLGCFLLAGGGSQFFFGYVENYVLQYVVTALFVVTGWFSIEKKHSIYVPIGCFALMVALHLGNLVFFPGVLILLYLRLGNNKARALLAMAGLSGLILALMFILGFHPRDFLRHVTSGSVDFLQPFAAEGGNFAYAMFSLAHLWDWLNAGFLIVPFGLAIAVTMVVMQGKELRWADPLFLFLTVSSLCGLLFTWIINSALGMARDWDLLASFFVPLMILDVYLLGRASSLKIPPSLLAFLTGFSLLHTAAWIGVNASADRHLKRIELLDSPRYMSKTSLLVYDEALASHFTSLEEYPQAKAYYEKYLQIDDRNPRILANISEFYGKMGEKEKYFWALKRAVEMKSRDPRVYENLGVEYANRQDTLAAVRCNEQAIAMDSTQILAHGNLGILYACLKNYPLAERHFAAAIRLGMKDPAIFRFAGDVCYILNENNRAVEYYTSYLELVPSDQKIRATRDQIIQAMEDPEKHQ